MTSAVCTDKPCSGYAISDLAGSYFSPQVNILYILLGHVSNFPNRFNIQNVSHTAPGHDTCLFSYQREHFAKCGETERERDK